MTTTQDPQRRPGELHCEGCSLHSSCMTRTLSQGALEAFDEIIRQPQPLKRGQALVLQGQPFRSLYLVRTGSFKQVMRQQGRQDEQVVHFFLPSEAVGLEALSDEP